ACTGPNTREGHLSSHSARPDVADRWLCDREEPARAISANATSFRWWRSDPARVATENTGGISECTGLDRLWTNRDGHDLRQHESLHGAAAGTSSDRPSVKECANPCL